MPKISNHNVRIYNKMRDLDFAIEILYNQDVFFYAVIPECFNENFDLLSENELDKFGASTYSKKKYDREGRKRIISAASESECLSQMKKFIEYLADYAIIQRNVIIVFFNNNGTTYEGMAYSDKTPKIQMEYGLSYCVETKLPGAGNPKYFIYTEHKSPFREEVTVTKKEVRIWGASCTVIDDTPENRAFLENIYANFKKLIEAMDEHTKTNDTLLQLITSGQKLIA